jgi:hypothetical protein
VHSNLGNAVCSVVVRKPMESSGATLIHRIQILTLQYVFSTVTLYCKPTIATEIKINCFTLLIKHINNYAHNVSKKEDSPQRLGLILLQKNTKHNE